MEQELVLAARYLLSLGLFGLGINLVAQLCAHIKLASTDARSNAKAGVSILKPIKGLDEGLYENLASLAIQDYGTFELLIAIDDPSDPAIPIVRQVQHDFPVANIELIVRPDRAGLNPKVNNLLSALQRAKHPLLLISDSNVRVGPDYLRHVVAPTADPSVALVSNLIRGAGGTSLGGHLENQHFNTFVVSAVTLAERVGLPTVIGKSMLIRRTALEQLGGLDSVRDVLAEDYVLGKRMHEAGFRVALSPYLVDNINRSWSLARFFRRHQRWAQIRRWAEPSAFIIEPLAFAGLWLALGGASAALAHAPDLASLSICAMLALFCGDVAITRRMQGSARAANLLRPLREALLLLAWLSAWVKRDVQWRGNALRVGPGTELTTAIELQAQHTAP